MGVKEFFNELFEEKSTSDVVLSKKDVFGGVACVLAQKIRCTKVQAEILVRVKLEQAKKDTRIFPNEEFDVKDGWVYSDVIRRLVPHSKMIDIEEMICKKLLIEKDYKKGWYRINEKYHIVIEGALNEYEGKAI
jgi:hypothetical protein